ASRRLSLSGSIGTTRSRERIDRLPIVPGCRSTPTRTGSSASAASTRLAVVGRRDNHGHAGDGVPRACFSPITLRLFPFANVGGVAYLLTRGGPRVRPQE